MIPFKDDGDAGSGEVREDDVSVGRCFSHRATETLLATSTGGWRPPGSEGTPSVVGVGATPGLLPAFSLRPVTVSGSGWSPCRQVDQLAQSKAKVCHQSGVLGYPRRPLTTLK